MAYNTQVGIEKIAVGGKPKGPVLHTSCVGSTADGTHGISVSVSLRLEHGTERDLAASLLRAMADIVASAPIGR